MSIKCVLILIVSFALPMACGLLVLSAMGYGWGNEDSGVVILWTVVGSFVSLAMALPFAAGTRR